MMQAVSALTVMEAGFKIIPGKEEEFLKVQNGMVPIGMQQPGFVEVYGGPIAASTWLYFGVRFASPQQMNAWHQHRGHRAVQQRAYEQWWTAMYIRKWTLAGPKDAETGRVLCETRLVRVEALSPAQLQEVQAALTELSELDVLPFETLTGQFEPQPYQLVGPLELAPAVAGVSYTLITHWRSVRDAAKWLESEPYARLARLGRVTSQTFVPYKEVNERDFLRNDKLQRDWVLDGA